MTARRRTVLENLSAFGFYALALCAASWPVPVELATRVVGDERSGAWRTLWAHWWTKFRILQDGSWPLDATEIAFPRGGAFSSIAPVNDAVSLPLQVFLELVPAYNGVVYFHWMLACMGGWWLARACGLKPGGALLAGTIFGFNGFLLSYGLGSAVVETNTQGWAACFLAAMVWLVRRPGPLPAVATGVLFAITGLSSFYWALIVGLLTPVVALPALLDRRRRGEKLGPAIVAALASILVAAAVFTPFALALLDTYGAEDALLHDYSVRKQSFVQPEIMTGLAHDFATVTGYLVPGPARLKVHADMDRLTQTTYLGWAALMFAVFGFRRGVRRWAVVGFIGLVLSVGPFVFVDSTSFLDNPVWWWVSLREWVPPSKMVTSYVRFSIWAFLGLGVLAAAAVDRLGSARSRWTVGVLASVAVVGEAFLLSPAVVPIPSAPAVVPEVSRQLATLPREGAVLDWPQRYSGEKVELSRYFFYQSAHARPIPYDFAPTSYMPGPIESNPFFLALEIVTFGQDYETMGSRELADLPIRRGIADLDDMGFAYVVLHTGFVEPSRQELVTGWLDMWLERVGMWDGDVIYSLDATGY
ncbi:MAG: YfhO family protein [Proteobacteria bacterium]|nr:YfhO family protein [Pseudomonadota bacterium]MCP4919207.1 YfhO family protein [Pseudomonadota bacterium]